MNCQKGDLAYIVVPPGFKKTLDRKFVNVGVDGTADLGNDPTPGRAEWLCEFHVPWIRPPYGEIRKVVLLDSWLRPVRPQPDEAEDQSLTWLESPVVRV